MASANYVAYSPSVVFVDDIAGAGGTPLTAANFNGLRADLTTYVQNHINGAANNHSTADLYDADVSEALAYANATGAGPSGTYDSHSRFDMAFTLFKSILGGTGSLTTRIAAFTGASGSDISSLFTTVTAHGVALNAPRSVAATVSDYKAGVNAVAATITIAAGGSWTDANGAYIPAAAQQTAALPTQPTGTNIQYVALSLAPTTGAPVATGGPVGASPAFPTFPVLNKPVALITWRGATTLPSGIVASSDIFDVRNFGGGGGAGGGGGTTDAVMRAVAVLTNGNATATAANSIDVTSTSQAAIIAPNVVKGLASIVNPFVQYDLGSPNHYGASVATVNFTASAVGTSPGPLTVARGALVATNTATVQATASGAAGTRYMIADPSVPGTAGQLWTLVSPMPSSVILTSNQVYLGSIEWDGTNLWTQSANFSPLQNINSIQVGKQTYHASAATVSGLTSTTYATPSGYTAAAFAVATACKARITNVVDVVNSTGTGTFNVAARIQPVTGGGGMLTGNYAVFKQFGAAAASEYTGTMVTEITLQPGTYILDQQYLVTGSCSLAIATSFPLEAWIDLWAAV